MSWADDKPPVLHAAGDGNGTAARLFLLAVAIGSTFAPLNSTMIAVAIPDIQDAFGVSVSDTAWLVTLYLVAMAAGQPVGGALGDQLGRRRVYLFGLAWFALASIGCALSPNLPVLILFRIQQALAGALSFPNGAAMIRESVPRDRQGSGFGLIGLSTGSAAALGPPLGGFLVDRFGWASVFWVNVPLAIVALALGWRALPRHMTTRRRRSFDAGGTGLLTLALGTVIFVPTLLKSQGPAVAVAAILVAAVIGIAFVRHELTVAHPVVNTGLFKHREFVAACSSNALANLVMYTALLALPQYLEDVLDHSLRDVGLVLMALSACSALLGPLGGRWADRSGRWMPAVVAGCALLLGAALLALGVEAQSLWLMVPGLALTGVGIGIGGAALMSAATGSVPIEEAGSASGVFSTSRYLGSIAGASVLAAMFAGEITATDQSRFTLLFAMLVVAAAAALYANTKIGDRTVVQQVGAVAD
jgi:DHA2 family methylenomycin A resistance protein-like MFS transporter